MRGAFVRSALLQSGVSGFSLIFLSARLAGAQEPAAAAPQPAPEAAPAPAPAEPAAREKEFELEVGGGFMLWYYQPLEDPDGGTAKANFEVFEAQLRLDAKFGRYWVHIMPVFRDTKERGFFPGEGWVKEAYAATKLGPVTIKVGKTFAHLGKFWDNSWYGNAQQYDGLKLDLNHGVSLEGAFNEGQPFELGYWLQYFIIDGTTSYAQPNRDTQAILAIPGAHRRNQVFGRIEPRIKLGDTMGLVLGVGASHSRADIPTVENTNVERVAVDATFTAGGLAAWAEYSQQWGRHVTDFPLPGGSDENRYLMFGIEYTYDWFTARYNFNFGDYTQVDYSETRHNVAVAASLDKHLSLLLEWVRGTSVVGDADPLLGDNSLNLTIHSNF